jgi:hypothetical protein
MGIDGRSGSPNRVRSRRTDMKARLIREGENHMSSNEQVRREIQIFLQALDSYPDRFAREPKITFEEHRSSLTEAGRNSRRRRLRLRAS